MNNNIQIKKEIQKRYFAISKRTDQLFVYLFVAQWILGILFACFASPLTWTGDKSQLHIHVYAAVFLGGLLMAGPIFMIWLSPGATINRYIVATSQILFSVLFIHLTGGRIETHFHVFGSLAFLAIYRDWRPVLLGTLITACDHLLRGALWPQSVYGTLTSTPWRALEHASWVIFEDIVLFRSIITGSKELKQLAQTHVELRESLAAVEDKVYKRTRELKESQSLILKQKEAMLISSKMASLGQMSAGVAHEINNPLAIISGSLELLQKLKDQPDKFNQKINSIQRSCERISKIVLGLKKYSRSGTKGNLKKCSLCDIVKEVLILTEAKSNQNSTPVSYICNGHPYINCDEIEIEQVIVNLVNNAIDAVKNRSDKWVKLEVFETESTAVLRVIDSGNGIPENIKSKLFEPFFTTKVVGEGTGLGLSITKGILDEHAASIEILDENPNTCFEIKFPKVDAAKAA